MLLVQWNPIKIIFKIPKWLQINFSPIFWCRESCYPIFHIFYFWRKIIWIISNNSKFKNNSKRTLNLILWNSQLIFHMLWRSHFIFARENHWVAWSLWIRKYFQMEFKYFSNTLFIYLNGRSHVIFSLGFCGERNLNSWRS